MHRTIYVSDLCTCKREKEDFVARYKWSWLVIKPKSVQAECPDNRVMFSLCLHPKLISLLDTSGMKPHGKCPPLEPPAAPLLVWHWVPSPASWPADEPDGPFRVLVQSTASQIVGNDNISDSIKHKLDVVGVSGTCHMTVDLFCCGFVLGFKLGLDICCCLSIFLRTYVRHKALITGWLTIEFWVWGH